MKRFMMAFLLINALHCFAAEDGSSGSPPSQPGPAACMIQAFQGTRMLLQEAVKHPRVLRAMREFGQVVNIVMDGEDVSNPIGDPEVAENQGNDIEDAASDISPNNNSLSDAARERIAEMQAKIVALEEELARKNTP